ncbi:MAG: 4-hydroxy-2-oxovalerate aldolase [Lawsonibacter sp.]|jgi:4-hydroxy 2-oxovalerate aldolase
MLVMDCTLRDGANVVGKGFNATLTKMMIEGMISAGITTIEMGNCLGLGAYEANHSISPCTDEEYLELIQPYLSKAEIGMFMGYKNATQQNIDLGAKYGLKFLRIGANAGDGVGAYEGVKKVKAAGMKCRYSMMKAYILSPEKLAEEAKRLEECGLDEITIMDSAGTMLPHQVSKYTEALVNAVSIPVAFHGHNNLGLSVANAIAAAEAGATVFDCGLLGMARSAGNCATELLVATFQRLGWMKEIDLYQLLSFLDAQLIPAMEEYNYHTAVKPYDLILGLSGCHSSFGSLFQKVSEECGVPLYPLIVEVSKLDQKAPSEELIYQVASKLK